MLVKIIMIFMKELKQKQMIHLLISKIKLIKILTKKMFKIQLKKWNLNCFKDLKKYSTFISNLTKTMTDMYF